MGFPMVGGVGLHRETGAAPRLYRARSTKSIGLGPKSVISRKNVRFSKHSYTGRSTGDRQARFHPSGGAAGARVPVADSLVGWLPGILVAWHLGWLAGCLAGRQTGR